MLASTPAQTLNPIRSRRETPRFSLFGKCSSGHFLAVEISRGVIVLGRPGSDPGHPPFIGQQKAATDASAIGSVIAGTSVPHPRGHSFERDGPGTYANLRAE